MKINKLKPIETNANVVSLFSGGRDSSLATCIYAKKGYNVQLLRFITGTGIPSNLPKIREKELIKVFPNNIHPVITLPAYGLFRRIAIAAIEDDFKNFNGKNLILLGEKLAITAIAISYCQNHNIPIIISGVSGYQQDMPEQRPVAVDFFKKLAAKYNVDYQTPIMSYNVLDDVKYELWDFGISTKSLESISIFSDSFTFSENETILRYLHSKMNLCDDFIEKNHHNINLESHQSLGGRNDL